MTVLQAVATYIPPVGQSLSEVADELQLSVLDVKIYEKFYGLRDYRIDRQATGADLLIHAARALPTLGPAGHRVRYVLHGKSVPPSGSHADPPVQSVLTPLGPVSYTHLRAHETVLDLVCRLLLEKQNK